MAIDTETKRRSVVASFVMALVVLPVPDASIDVGDRAHVAGIYSGITFGGITPDICGPLFSALVDADRVSALVDSDRISTLECN